MKSVPSINFSQQFYFVKLQEAQLIEGFFEESYISPLSVSKKDTFALIKNISDELHFQAMTHHRIILCALLDSFSEYEIGVITQTQPNIEKLINILKDAKEDDMFEKTYKQIADAFFLNLQKRQEVADEFESYIPTLMQNLPRGEVDTHLSKVTTRISILIKQNQIIDLKEINGMEASRFSHLSLLINNYNSSFTPELPNNLKSVFVKKAQEIKTNFEKTFNSH